VNDRAVNVLSEYEIEVLRTWKGRGSILFETPQGICILKEYKGRTDRLAQQNKLLSHLIKCGNVQVEALLPNKEGELYTTDQNQDTYIVKTYFSGSECSIRSMEDCKKAMQILAQLHKDMVLPEEGNVTIEKPLLLDIEYEKHNRELKKVRRFLRNKGQKNDFEMYLLQYYDYFMEKAFAVTERWNEHKKEVDTDVFSGNETWCHGDYQYHNLIFGEGNGCVINFEKCARGSQIKDLYLFLRKLLEKNNWMLSVGDDMLEAYQKVRPLCSGDLQELYYRLAYPEKFWKIINFYYNTGKAWIPGKNMEKFDILLKQEAEKELFLKTLLRD